MIEKTKRDAIKMAEMYEREAQRLINAHGDGVRPAWVSTDLSLAQHRAEKFRALADSLKE